MINIGISIAITISNIAKLTTNAFDALFKDFELQIKFISLILYCSDWREI